MAAVQESRTFTKLSADQAYKAAEQAFEEAGYDIWKRRPLGWLLRANKDFEGGKITGNGSARPGANSVVTFSLECPDLTEAELKKALEALFTTVQAIENA